MCVTAIEATAAAAAPQPNIIDDDDDSDDSSLIQNIRCAHLLLYSSHAC